MIARDVFDAADPDRGEWDEGWTGWWGDEPPYHAPVFVLAHRPREPLAMQGGTTFTFVTDGIQAALEQAREAAGSGDVAIAGGAATVNQYLAAGAIDELRLHVAPVVLGVGERLFEGVGPLSLERAGRQRHRPRHAPHLPDRPLGRSGQGSPARASRWLYTPPMAASDEIRTRGSPASSAAAPAR